VPERADAWRARPAQVRAARRLALEYVLSSVVGALAARNVRSLVLKGPAFAHWLYDDPSRRWYGDLDLLVAPADLATSREVLAALGFVLLPEGTHEHECSHHDAWRRTEKPTVTVELHRTLPLVAAAPEVLWERFNDGPRSLAISGGVVETPGLAASALLAVLHTAWHGNDVANPRRDLVRAVGLLDAPTWHAAAVLARDLDCEAAFVAGLARVPCGLAVLDSLGLGDARLPRPMRLLAGPRPHTAAGVELLVTTPGVRARGRLLATKLVPSPGFMRAAYPLARRGRAGLAATYLWRPLEILIHLPRGVAAWLTAAWGRDMARGASPGRARRRARARRR